MYNSSDWQKIYSAYSPKLLGICRRYIQDLSAAEDILQDSFIAAMQKKHQLKDEKVIFAWLKKIVVNNALQYLRKNSKEVFIVEEPSEIPEISFAMNDTEEKPHILAYDFTREELLASIDSLPSHHKSVFNLYCIENYSHAEISNMLGIPVNTSKSHLLRAKKSIQNYLLNTILKPGTPKNKKKLTQLLIFLGLGGLLWAQTFRNSFAGFSVSPSQPFTAPGRIDIQNISFTSHSNNRWKIKIIVASALLIIVLSYILFFRPQKNNFSGSTTPENNTESTTDKKEIKKASLDKSVTEFTDQNHSESIKLVGPDPILEKNKITVEKNLKIKSKEPMLSAKDSAQEKVIVVKKIIQRDTIYVER